MFPSNKFTFYIIITAAFIIWSPHSEATSYYLSSSKGSDSNDGQSVQTPWKNLDRIYIKSSDGTIIPGDKILLHRGDVWHDQLVFVGRDNKASQDNQIYIGAYDEGAAPTIIGDSETFNWTEVPEHPGIFRAELGAGGSIMHGYEGPKALKGIPAAITSQTDTKTLDKFLKQFTPGSFGPVGGRGSVVYVKTRNNKKPVFPHISLFRFADISLVACNNLVLENLVLKNASTAVDLERSKDIVIRNLHINDIISLGIYLRGNNSHVLVENNVIDRIGNDAVYILKSNENTVRGNHISHLTTKILGHPTGGDKAAIGLQESRGNLVEKNVIENVKGGIDFYFETGSTVRDNFIFHSLGFGTPHGTDLNVYNNVINVDPPNYGNGINVINTGDKAITVRNNIFYGAAAYGLMDQTPQGKGPVIFRNNIVFCAKPVNFIASMGPNTDSDFNCFFSNGKTRFRLNKTTLNNLKAFQRNTRLETHSVYAHPQFISLNPSKREDFTLKSDSPCGDAGPK